MDLNQMQYFTVCAEWGSFSAAALKLYTSQPHVSQVIGSLEKEVGTALFERTARGIRLTRAGEDMIIYARHIMKDISAIRETAPFFRGSLLRVAVNPSSLLSAVTDEYYRTASGRDISVEYTECGTERMISLVGQRGYDLGLLFVPVDRLGALGRILDSERVRFCPIADADLVVNCGPLGPFRDRDAVEPYELDGCDCIQSREDYFSVEDILRNDEMFRRKGCRINRAVSTNSDHLMIRMLRDTALCNIGMSWKNRAGTLGSIAVPIRGFEDSIQFGYICSKDHELSEETLRFLEHVKKHTGP